MRSRFAALLIALLVATGAAVAARASPSTRQVRAFGVALAVPADWRVSYEANDFWARSPGGGPADLEAAVSPAPRMPLSAIGAATVKHLRSYAAKSRPSTRLSRITVGGRPALRLIWEYNATYDYGPNGGSPHRVRLCGTDFLFVHRGQLYDLSYQTIRPRLEADGRVFAESIASLRFTR
jgi:hypothetical protein